MAYVFTRPEHPVFIQKGLKGFPFPLKNKEADLIFADVEKGLEWFIISKKITHIYYVIDGQGFFTIEGQRYDVKPGMVVEIPPGIEYSYSGTMKVLLIHAPPFFEGNNQIIRDNPDVSVS